ncbi:hypothetical protein AnigIFM63309_008517 [Aspergillus niger]|nr:hypothetical protein AnigIFM63309_008517 [Aspergillus niger]
MPALSRCEACKCHTIGMGETNITQSVEILANPLQREKAPEVAQRLAGKETRYGRTKPIAKNDGWHHKAGYAWEFAGENIEAKVQDGQFGRHHGREINQGDNNVVVPDYNHAGV